jgi:hypothetical protein
MDHGQPGGPGASTAVAPKKRSLKALWISLAVVGALVVVGGGAGIFALVSFAAPGVAALSFCQNLEKQNYDAAYTQLSANLAGVVTKAQFTTGSQQLDNAEGKVTACAQGTGSDAYSYSLGANKATVAAVITREKGSFSGNVQVVSENGSWKIAALGTSLLGANLGALVTLNTFCTDMATQKYADAYAMLGSTLQTGIGSAANFGLVAGVQDQIDGKVTGCALTSVAQGNTDTSTSVTVTITRTSAHTGAVTLSGDSTGKWTITKIDQSAQGTDVGPIITGAAFCGYLDAGLYPQAYALFSSTFQGLVSEALFQSAFSGSLPTGAKWGACTPDFSTYKVTGTTATYNGSIDVVLAGGTKVPNKITLNFVQEGGVWKIDNFA